MAERTELKQTKNSFKFVGKVSRIDKDGAFKQDTATKGKNEGKEYRSLRFGVKTSGNNEMTVQMYDFEPEEVFMWNSEKAKEAKEKKKTYKGDRFPYSEWLEDHEELGEKGFAILSPKVGLSYGEDGKKLEVKGLPSYVAQKTIFDNLNNGDSVVIEGDIRYSTYKNQQDKLVEQKTFTIKKAFRIKDIDFDGEKFEEVTYFEQEFVFVDGQLDTKEKKAFITGRVIDYSKKFHDTQFVVNYDDGNGGEDSDMKKLATALTKKFKFGDVLTVFGDAVNRVITEEVEDEGEDEQDELLKSLGGKSKPKHAQKFTARTYISEMQIHGVEDFEKKVYVEDDFVTDDLIEDKKASKMKDEFGGKSKKKNPFADVDDSNIDISDEDLPF